MEQAVVDGLIIAGAFVAVILMQVIVTNALTHGWLVNYIKVRISRGRKTLLFIHSVTDVYYRAGYFYDNELHYKNRSKKECIIVGVDKSCIYTTLGVQALDIDEEHKTLWTREGAIIDGNDPEKVDNIIDRALQSPEVKSLLIKLLVACLIVFIIFVVTQIGFDYYLLEAMKTLSQARGVV
jgi:hypothetical protein